MKGRLVIAALIALVSVFTYLGSNQVNPVTGEKQRIDISPQQETVLGLQAAPQMAQEFGGLDPDRAAQARLDEVGTEIVAKSDAKGSPYKFDFHLLADSRTINAFALPGGQVFITRALYDQLQTKGQLAGVLGHEIGHVVGRHSAEQMAKQKLSQGLTGAAAIATTDPNDPRTYRNGAMAQMVAQLVSLRFSRGDELEADTMGVKYIAESGYDPRAMIGVMEILAKSGGPSGPEFFQTHPNPQNRITKLQEAIKKAFPQGVPTGLAR